ncbi:MAG TPA: hypothetical protein VJ625_07385 [Propionibacteriaceae bacterium]|nr:hypothetical protein [Propionibacteriaceae bacterium]
MPTSVDEPALKGRQAPRLAVQLFAFAAASLGLGAAAGVLWWLVVNPPAYELNSNGGASTSERGLTEFISGDAWFCAIGLVVGLLIGLAAWRWLRSIGWTVVLVVLVCAVAAALTCWLVGYRLGPGDFSARLAAAQPGQLVPIPLTLRARASLLTWPFFAVIPVLLGSSLGRDEDEPRPLLRRRTRLGDQPQ